MRLLKLKGRFESQVVTEKGKRLLAKSTSALAVKDADGKLTPVDMTLTRTAAGDFAPRNSVAPVTLGSRADEGLHLQSTYGGAYLDNAAGGLVRVRFTQDASAHQSAIAALLPIANRLRMETTTISETALAALDTQVNNDISVLRADGFDVSTVARDVANQRIEVGVPSPTEELRQKLAARYGTSPVVLIAREPLKPMASGARTDRPVPPLAGGLLLSSITVRSVTDVTLRECTSAFSMQYLGKYRVLTAGHCGTKGTVWGHPGPLSPRIIQRSQAYSNGGDIDVALLQISKRYATRDALFRPGGPNTITRINRAAVDRDYHSGLALCVLGSQRDRPRCGVITKYERVNTAPAGQPPFYLRLLLMRSNNDFTEGDSGAPVVGRDGATRNVGYGVFSSGDGKIGGFTPMPTIYDRYAYRLYNGGQ